MPETVGDTGAVGRVIAARYQLVTLLDAGGTSQVWEGRDLLLARPVALRITAENAGSGDPALERLRADASVAARLAHPNMVALYDSGTTGGQAFLVMEHVEGAELAELVGREGPLDPERAANIASRVAAALAFAHRHGAVHGSLSAARVLVGEDDLVKVTGFEGARSFSDATQDFEDAMAQDIRSLGSLLFEMLCGSPPALDGPCCPSSLRPDVPPWLDAACARALAAGASASELAALLRSQAPGAGVPARDAPTPPAGISRLDATAPIPDPPAARRRRRRLPTAVAALALAAAASVAMLALRLGSGSQASLGLHRGTPSAGATTLVQLPIAGGRSFDPQGDGTEDPAGIPNLWDGNPETYWETDIYATREFGNLKRGVGFILWLRSEDRLARLTLATSTLGWQASVYVARSPQATLGAWGKPVASGTDAGPTLAFGLRDVRGEALLVWFTRLGPARQVRISEATVLGAP